MIPFSSLASLRNTVIFAAALGILAAEAEETWDAGDTRLANHYILSLQQNPEYGKVLHLLWEHYEKHGQTRLLLQYFDTAAKRDDNAIARLINGHLLRKKGNAEAALEAYQAVSAEFPDNAHALRAMAEISRQLGFHDQALEHFARLGTLLGPEAEDWAQIQMARAELLRKLGQNGEAIELWLATLKTRPGDLGLRKQIVALLLEEGQTEAAIASYAPLLESAHVETRVLAMKEVARLHEFVDDFDNAVKMYRQALATVHFKHYLHDEFLVRMVRVHERFGRAEALGDDWRKAAQTRNPTEEALLRMVRFTQIAANPTEEETWLRRLVERVPSSTEYRQQLAQRLVDNDHYAEAEAILAGLAKRLRPTPLAILLLQAKVKLTTQGVEAAEALIAAHLDQSRPNEEGLKRLLRFSQTHYLDSIAERLLIDQHKHGWGEEGRTPELQLASFHHERGRLAAVREVLRDYAAAAKNDAQRGERLLQIAEAFRDLSMFGAAREAAEQAIEAGLATRGHFLVFAETLVAAGRIEEAIAAFERGWELSETTERRIEVDQRIFNVLRANSDETKLEKPAKITEGEAMASVWRFFHKLRQRIDDAPTPENRFRLAWWSVKTTDYEDAWTQLPLLHDPANPTLAYEELLLDLAERTNSRQLIVRQLKLIATIDPGRQEEAEIREAMMMLEQKLEDRAIRKLRDLVDRPNSTLKAVQALAKAYREQERLNALSELWAETFAEANILEKRQIVKPYVQTLIELERVPEALQLYGEMIEAESDLAQRRKLFEEQLTAALRHRLAAEWLLPRYGELMGQNPLDRFYPEALARIYLARDRIDEALVAMKRAYYMADDDPQLLKELGELSSRSSDLKAAIYYQRQLIAAEDDRTTPEDWLALIQRLERGLRVAEADQTRRRLESKFGQDPDFLKQLSRHYLNAGDQVAARRILGKIAALRPWDAESVLELGLLRLETGDVERAEAAFRQVLRETRQAVPNAYATIETVPFVPAKLTRPVPGQPGHLNLEDMAVAIDEYDFLPAGQLDWLAEWFRQPKPEFLRNPGSAGELRLRAIEELAKLGNGDGLKDEELADATERLWAHHHAGRRAEALDLLDREIRPKTRNSGTRWDLLYPLMALQHGGSANLKTWVEGDPLRKAHLTLAAFLLLLEPSFEIEVEELKSALALVELPLRQTRAVVHELRMARRFRQALQFGEAAVETQNIADHIFFVDLAQICEQTGFETGRRRWLDRAFRSLTLGTRLPYYAFYTTVREMYRMQPNAEGQQRVIADVRRQIQQMPDSIGGVRTKAEMWLALAAGRPDEAMRHLAEVARLTTERRKQFTGERESDKGVETWVELETLMNLAGQRVPRDQLASLARALDLDGVLQPAEESSAAQFQQFRMIRLLWELETAVPPRRRQLIEEFLANVTAEEEPMELARSLEVRGLAPDALPIYRQMVREKSTEMSAVAGYLGSCRQARAYEEAIDFLDQIYIEGVPRPDTMSDEFIHQNYANLFYLAGNEDELTARADQEVAEGWRSNQYRRHLAKFYERKGNLDAAIRIYLSLADDRPLGFSDTLMLGGLMVENGDLPGAIALLEKLQVAAKTSHRHHVNERLARWYAQQNPDDTERLAKLVGAPKESWSASSISAIAASLADAGKIAEADAILTLKARSAAKPADRFQLLIHRARLRLTHAELSANSAALQQLLATWPGTAEAGEMLLDLVQETAPAANEMWQAAAGAMTRARNGAAAALAVQLMLADAPEASNFAARASRFPSAHLRFVAQAATRAQQPRLAWNLLETLHARHEHHPLEDGRLILTILSQLDDGPAILEWRQRALNWNQPTADIAELAGAFAEIGHPNLAASLYEHHHHRLRILTRNDQHFLTQYARFLTSRRQFRDAERVLLALFHKSIGGDPMELIDFYGAWDRLGKLEVNLRKFFLDEHTTRIVLEAAKAYPNHRPANEESAREIPPRPGLKRAF